LAEKEKAPAGTGADSGKEPVDERGKDKAGADAPARRINRDPLAQISEIESVISADGPASQARRELRETGFDFGVVMHHPEAGKMPSDPLLLIDCWVSDSAPPASADFEVIHADVGNVRRVQTTRHLQENLHEKLYENADQVALRGWLAPLPKDLQGAPALIRRLADWIKDHPLKIPDRRSLYGRTRILELLMLSAEEQTGGKLSHEELAGKIAAVLGPVAEHFTLPTPRKDSLLKYLLASRRIKKKLAK
jgi:hypothetical protein